MMTAGIPTPGLAQGWQRRSFVRHLVLAAEELARAEAPSSGESARFAVAAYRLRDLARRPDDGWDARILTLRQEAPVSLRDMLEELGRRDLASGTDRELILAASQLLRDLAALPMPQNADAPDSRGAKGAGAGTEKRP